MKMAGVKRRHKFFLFFVLIVVGVVLMLLEAGSFLVKKDKLFRADAIVLLMGSIPDRVLQTELIYKQGLGRRIILVEESMEGFHDLRKRGSPIVSNTDQCYNALVYLGVNEEFINVLPGSARSTIQEALIIKDFIKSNPSVDTLILVSSPSHTRRASMIFSKILKHYEVPAVIYASPGEKSTFNAARWWKSREDIQYVLTEYVKILSFLFIDQFKI
ncbi:hypothetical protein DSECCO2_283680 [anaerobic digester metagenome]